jgi:ornithine cyclodeaminase/alanine dehydrogenase-like protein (mu-crystallin family)
VPAALPHLTAEDLHALVPPAEAAEALRAALLAGTWRGADPPRSVLPVASGQLLLMPSEGADTVGVKLATVAPDAPVRGLPRIAAVYVLFDAATLQPLAVLDGTALTSLRTPAVSAVAVAELVRPGPHRVVVFGTGPQARGHVTALREVVPFSHVTVVGRSQERAAAWVEQLRRSGLSAAVGRRDDVADAGLVVCATDARTPVLSGSAVPDDACVVAVGSHEPTVRELDGAVLRRAATVVVEDVDTALREAGDVVLAVQEGALDPAALVDLADLLRTGPPSTPGPRVFKSVGMAWEDRVVAERAHRKAQRR